MTLLSVVLPVRNGTPYIQYSIESIINQQFSDFELIVVDNRSTDETVDIARSFSDPRIRIVHESHPGGPAAFNSGLRVARGKYIGRMDADDEALPDRFRVQISFLERRKDIHIVGSQAYKIDKHGELIGTAVVPQNPIAIHHVSRYGAPFVHPTLMFRREVWDRLGGYRDFSPGADYDMLCRAHEFGFRMANLPHFLLKYRVLPDSVSHTRRQKTIIHSLAVKKMHRLRLGGQDSKEQAILKRLQTNSVRQHAWFTALDRQVYWLTEWRNRRSLTNASDARITLANILIAGISALHYHMGWALWSTVRAKMVAARYSTSSTGPSTTTSATTQRRDEHRT